MSAGRPIAYVSGPLQAAADLDEARRLYEDVADICDACGFDAYLPHAHTDPQAHRGQSPSAVFERDIAAMRSADVIIAHIGPPSSGVGAELALAYEAGQPIVGFWQAHDHPSRFIKGMLSAHGSAVLTCFETREELRPHLSRALDILRDRVADDAGLGHPNSAHSLPPGSR